jgi:PAS domain S-box-containing protein
MLGRGAAWGGAHGAPDARMATPDTAALSTPPSLTSATAARLALVVRIETVLLVLRYVSYIGLIVMHAVGDAPDFAPALLPATVGAVVHNVWTHGVLYTRRYALFLSPLNFTIHLLKVSLLVALTGAETSPLRVLYPMFIVAYALYSVDFRRVYRVAFLCAAAYAFVILGNWSVQGINPEYNPLVISYAALLMCAWLMHNIGEMIRRVELEADKRAQALASSEAMLRTILNSTADPIVVFNEAEFVTEVNDRACEFLDVPRHKLVGRRFRSMLFDDGTLPQKLAALRARGEYWGELIVAPAQGDERTVAFMARSFIRDSRRFFVAMLHDITEQKSVQEASRLANLRLEEVNDRLREVNALRLTFFSDISQRLRSPLSGILGFTDMLLGEELGEVTPDQRQALHSMRRSVLRVFALADEATTLGQSGAVTPEESRLPDTLDDLPEAAETAAPRE